MALFGGGVMIGPILGPVLGGWLTDNYNWRWVFLVNLRSASLCTVLMLRFMPKTETHRRNFDAVRFRPARARAGRAPAVPRPRSAGGLAVELGNPDRAWPRDRGGLDVRRAHGDGQASVVRARHVHRPQFRDGLLFMAVTGRAAARRARPAAAAAPDHVRLFGPAIGLPDRAARHRDADLDADGRPADRQDRRAAAGRARRRPDGRVALHDDRLRDRPAGTAGHRQRRRPGPRPRAHLRAPADAWRSRPWRRACGRPARHCSTCRATSAARSAFRSSARSWCG